MRPKIRELYKILEKEIKRAKSFSQKTHESATELAKAAAGSLSIAGDRYHAENSAEAAKEKLAKLEKLLEELKTSLKNPQLEKVETACFVRIGKEELFIVNTPIFLIETKLVSSQSPFGQELLGKKVGDTTSRGKIIAIE